MTLWLVGALLGASGGAGLLMVVFGSPPLRPVRLADRLAPYLGELPPPSRLLERSSATSAPFVVFRRIFGPIAGDLLRLLDRILGGATSVQRRLNGLGGGTTSDEFRVEQMIWGSIGLSAGAIAVAALGALRGGVDPLLTVGAAVVGLGAGVFGRDWFLTVQLQRREARMLAEFPVIADLLALAVTAGEAPADALARVCRLTRGELTRDLTHALSLARTGTPLTHALGRLVETTALDSFGRFLQGLIVAIERGTPLAEVLRAQAADVREVAKRSLLESGGKKEISMMVPVVFFLLPVTVIFALFPGLATLTSLTR